METFSSIIILVIIFWLGTIIIKSFSRGKSLRTVPAQSTALTGMYTLILYGGKHSNDLETVVILGKENSRYTFEPFASEFKYTTKKGVPAKEAIAEAEKFVSWHNSFQQSEIRGIIDDKGNTLGYELRPLYLPITFGAEDVADVNYKMEADRIIVYVSLNPSIEKKLSS